jgi:hypothetical protein
MPTTAPLPNIAELLAPYLAAVPREQWPLLIASAERMAAGRYREWAAASSSAPARSSLLACADREEDIALRVEALFPDSATTQATFLAEHPEIAELNQTLFSGRPIAGQYAIQAQGERVGAATWRSFAGQTEGTARQTFLDCAALEEASALVLETLLGT